MKKRHSKLRQTICVQRPEIKVDEAEMFSIRKNTDIQMYVTNDDYHKKWCQLCKKPQTHFVSHFVREHPEHEVPISRPSPTMAKKLRQQAQTFTQIQGKLTGLCWFCEESKSLPKYRWVAHYLVHTGIFYILYIICSYTDKKKFAQVRTCSSAILAIKHIRPEVITTHVRKRRSISIIQTQNVPSWASSARFIHFSLNVLIIYTVRRMFFFILAISPYSYRRK